MTGRLHFGYWYWENDLVEAMRYFLTTFLFIISTSMHAGDAADAFGPWTAFGKAELEKAVAGKAAMQCNSSMKFSRGLSAQAVYLVVAPLDVTSRALLDSDPTRHPELETYQHHRFQSASDAAFEKLALDPRVKAVRHLLDAMPKHEDLQFSHDEVAKLPKTGARAEAESFWAGVLRDRWSRAASRGDLGGADHYDARSEITTLLAEESGIAQHFGALLTPLTKGPAPLTSAHSYWDVSSVNNVATCGLGAVFTKVGEKRSQILDVTFYASSGYLASVTLYELVPLTHARKPCTFVWQGCLVSAPGLAGGFGVKRKIASVLTLNDLERSIRLFQQDAASAATGNAR